MSAVVEYRGRARRTLLAYGCLSACGTAAGGMLVDGNPATAWVAMAFVVIVAAVAVGTTLAFAHGQAQGLDRAYARLRTELEARAKLAEELAAMRERARSSRLHVVSSPGREPRPWR